MKILLAADGSDYTKRAARHLVDHLGWFARPAELHLLHVRPPLPYPGAAAHVPKGSIEKYEREESEAALAIAGKVLSRAGIAHQSAWRVGEVAATLCSYAKANRIDLIVMGSHGHGAIAGLALGSVATKVIAGSKIPVLIVR
jgi:nucleotide-binding universal stress UspA family protein